MAQKKAKTKVTSAPSPDVPMGKPLMGETESEIGMDEFWKFVLGMVGANMKRTYDEYQGTALRAIGENQSYVQKILADAEDLSHERAKIANIALSNMVENNNLLAKQAIQHRDIAVNKQWNLPEDELVLDQVLQTKTFQQTIQAAAAATAAEMVKALKEAGVIGTK